MTSFFKLLESKYVIEILILLLLIYIYFLSFLHGQISQFGDLSGLLNVTNYKEMLVFTHISPSS